MFCQFRDKYQSICAIMADEKDEKTIAEDIVVTKYKMAGEIVNSELGKNEILLL